MTHDELLAIVIGTSINVANSFPEIIEEHLSPQRKALRAVVELHKPYDSKDTPHELAMGWCKGCSIEYSIKEYASQPYPCPTIQAIEKELK